MLGRWSRRHAARRLPSRPAPERCAHPREVRHGTDKRVLPPPRQRERRASLPLTDGAALRLGQLDNIEPQVCGGTCEQASQLQLCAVRCPVLGIPAIHHQLCLGLVADALHLGGRVLAERGVPARGEIWPLCEQYHDLHGRPSFGNERLHGQLHASSGGRREDNFQAWEWSLHQLVPLPLRRRGGRALRNVCRQRCDHEGRAPQVVGEPARGGSCSQGAVPLWRGGGVQPNLHRLQGYLLRLDSPSRPLPMRTEYRQTSIAS
mmetsp:Transcript_124502/g.346587  ORF Transcript_124502/g.346587 Transcript_124502/m.346587 type:complete len:262 (-) Transcript_124502:37-822(-)